MSGLRNLFRQKTPGLMEDSNAIGGRQCPSSILALFEFDAGIEITLLSLRILRMFGNRLAAAGTTATDVAL
ncbi:hypothetical protein CK215_05800 [Mesorhizobium sp. WSM3864]|uniref:hypothetical protein n=1 Tax=Mesorhizobium sp. WSM3868 TaxID=2029405 RepID=UPI000BDB6F22|nr:hypothetical protein [Mesorhizobium sp. WSM3868]PBB93469.1 hypothetical protein CK215_05800 [Mesorhizobium sp. WSM3864]